MLNKIEGGGRRSFMYITKMNNPFSTCKKTCLANGVTPFLVNFETVKNDSPIVKKILINCSFKFKLNEITFVLFESSHINH